MQYPLHILADPTPWLAPRCSRRQIGTAPCDVASGPHSHWANGAQCVLSRRLVRWRSRMYYLYSRRRSLLEVPCALMLPVCQGPCTWRISSRDDSTRDEIVQRLHDMIRPGMSGPRSRWKPFLLSPGRVHCLSKARFVPVLRLVLQSNQVCMRIYNAHGALLCALTERKSERELARARISVVSSQQRDKQQQVREERTCLVHVQVWA